MTSLIWTCVYGGENYFNILRVSLESLVVFGKYTGHLCIFSDREPLATLQFVPSELRLKTMVLPFPATPGLQVRYECAELLPAGHDVFLYVDTDIIYDATVEPILAEIARTDQLCFSSEEVSYPALHQRIGLLAGKNLRGSEWFGLDLALKDGGLDGHVLPMINSGIMGASHLSRFLGLCRSVRDVISNCSQAYIRGYGDQPAVNYVALKSGGCSKLITRYVHFTRHAPDESSVRKGMALRGMVHFLWAQQLKYGEMVTYMATLDKVLVSSAA